MYLQSHWAPCAFTGMHPQTNPQSKFPPQPFPPIPGSMFYVIYLTRDSTAQCVCSPGAGFHPPEFWSPCGLPVSCCLATSVVRLCNSKRLVTPPRVYACTSGNYKCNVMSFNFKHHNNTYEFLQRRNYVLQNCMTFLCHKF